jgi:hypothetical protein
MEVSGLATFGFDLKKEPPITIPRSKKQQVHLLTINIKFCFLLDKGLRIGPTEHGCW